MHNNICTHTNPFKREKQERCSLSEDKITSAHCASLFLHNIGQKLGQKVVQSVPDDDKYGCCHSSTFHIIKTPLPTFGRQT